MAIITAPIIKVRRKGQLGNRMIQHMLALGIQARVPGARIIGSHLPEFGILREEAHGLEGLRAMRLGSHVIPYQEAIRRLKGGRIDMVEIRKSSSRLEYFGHRLPRFRKVFGQDRSDAFDWSRTLAIHLRLHRLEDLGDPDVRVHADYPPLPIAHYARLIAETALDPVFIGQLGDDPVSHALRARFARATFVRSADAMADWRLLHSAEHVAIAASTFSWLAAWLSPWSKRVFMPLAGFFNPHQRADVMMIPLDDPRYRFHDFAPERWEASPHQMDAIIAGEVRATEMDAEKIRAKYFGAVEDPAP